MNLAIIIGISEYDTQSNLPSCKNDANYFFQLLKTSQKYDDILYITENTDSNSIMDALDDYINKHSNSEINEIFLYFSGHGYFNEEEFYFCTSNINTAMINSTSVSNSNIDKLIRKLSPEVYVKVIDACESGSTYIKDIKNRERIFQKNYDGFKSCYFFSSSECTQGSYANEFISDFTKSFLENIKEFIIDDKLDDIKYRQIAGALSDEYSANSRQTPFFVSQGTLAEIFLSKNPNIEQFLKDLNLEKIGKEETESSSNSVEDVNKLIPTKIEATEAKNKLIDKIASNLKKTKSLLKEYDYNSEIININTDEVLNKYKIGKWLADNKDKYFIFASEKYSRKYHKNPLLNISTMFNDDDIEYELSSFQLNVDEKESIYQIELSSENHLPKYCCQLVVMYSLTKIYLLYDFTFSYPKNWDEYAGYNASEKVNIATINIKNKQTLDFNVNKICDEFYDFCLEQLKKYLDVLFEK